MLCIGSAMLAPGAAFAGEGSLQSLLRELSARGSLQINGATVYDLPVTQQFYQQRDYVPAWVNPAAIDELSASIEQAWREGMNPEDYHQRQVQGLMDGSLQLDAPQRDLLLTDSLVRLTYHYALGKVDPRDYANSWNFDRELPSTDPVLWAGQVVGEGGISAGLDQLKPRNPTYLGLIDALARYRQIAAEGGWPAIDAGPTLHPGDRDPRVVQLRRRLQAEGDLADDASPEPAYFDERLESAVIRFQHRYRLDGDGIVGKRTLAAMNVPVARRVGQIQVNLERARMLQDIPPTAVVVDIAGFEVSLFRDGRRVLQSRAQVGRPYRRTPVFHDEITYIEFNPTWTVPPSILRKDTLPAIKRDPDYLASHNMQVLTMDGAVVDPASVDWQAYPGQGFPYMIRQRPGPDNALGRLKIMFPNKHMVYLHDTPSRDLFNRSERTFSSGCIRVEKSRELAELLLDDPERWNLAAIERTIGDAVTRKVVLRQPMPVYLVYWTVQVQEGGVVHFKHDPYDRDAALLEVLKQPLVPDPGRLALKASG